MSNHKLIFSWKNNENLRDEIAAAGKKYHEEAEKIQGPNRAAKIFRDGVNVNRGFAHNEQETMEFAKAFENLGKLKERACVVERLDIALVDLAAVPEGEKFDKERKLKQARLEKYIKLAKRSGQYAVPEGTDVEVE